MYRSVVRAVFPNDSVGGACCPASADAKQLNGQLSMEMLRDWCSGPGFDSRHLHNKLVTQYGKARRKL